MTKPPTLLQRVAAFAALVALTYLAAGLIAATIYIILF